MSPDEPALPRGISVLQQRLIDTNDRIDRDVSRLRRMQAFNAGALPMLAEQGLVDYIGEAIADVFDLEFGAVWLLDADGAVREPCAAIGAACTPAQLLALGRHLARANAATDATRVLESADWSGFLDALQCGHAAFAWCRGAGRERPAAMILGGNTAFGEGIFDTVSPRISDLFGLFAQQVGSILENRAGRETIERQRHELAGYRENLERLAGLHTQELEIARQSAESASEARSKFIASMCHELRVPMDAILALAGQLRIPAADAAGRDRLERITASGEQLQRLIGDVLELSSLETGRLQLADGIFTAPQVVARACSWIADGARAKGLALRADIEPRLQQLRLQGDERRLSRALVNYLENAVKFAGRGDVTVRVTVTTPDDHGAMLRFEVEAADIGIEPAMLPLLFEPFGRSALPAARDADGMGLGLAIARSVANRMGGSAGVVSEPGKGSIFWFTATVRRAAELE